MTGIEIARTVVETKACHVFREIAAGRYEALPWTRVPGAELDTERANAAGWIALDLFSASAVVQVHDALKPENQAKFAAMHPVEMAEIAFRIMEKARTA